MDYIGYTASFFISINLIPQIFHIWKLKKRRFYIYPNLFDKYNRFLFNDNLRNINNENSRYYCKFFRIIL